MDKTSHFSTRKMAKGTQQSEKCQCLKNCRILGTAVVFLPEAAPIPSPPNTWSDGHEGSYTVGQTMTTGSKTAQLKRARLI